MSIRLETSKRQGIRNHQDEEISPSVRNWGRDLPRLHQKAQLRTNMSPVYNCHGLTFASRRTRIENTPEVMKILDDDLYEEIPMKSTLPGDIVIYYSNNGDANHSGVVVEYSEALVLPIVCSKWGSAGEFVHPLKECPAIYGPQVRFYRCRL